MTIDYKAMLDSVGKRACGSCGEMTSWKDMTKISIEGTVLCPECIRTADPDYKFERGSKTGEPRTIKTI